MSEKNPFLIDENDLAHEWRRVVGLTREYGYAKADAEYALNRAEAKLKVLAAQLELLIRRSPGLHDLPDKPVVNEVKATVETHPDYLRAVEDVDSARFALSIATTDVYAAVDMRRALENCVRLLQIHYYAEMDPKEGAAHTRQYIQDAAKRDARKSAD